MNESPYSFGRSGSVTSVETRNRVLRSSLCCCRLDVRLARDALRHLATLPRRPHPLREHDPHDRRQWHDLRQEQPLVRRRPGAAHGHPLTPIQSEQLPFVEGELDAHLAST